MAHNFVLSMKDPIDVSGHFTCGCGSRDLNGTLSMANQGTLFLIFSTRYVQLMQTFLCADLR